MKKFATNKIKINSGKFWFAVLICLLIATVVLMNILAIKTERRFSLVGDLTANSAYKIGPETSTVLQSLDKDIAIFVLSEESSFVGDSYLIQANRMIKEYPANTSRISLDYIDYVLEPTFVSQYPELVLEKGNILVTSGENTEQLKLSELFNYERNAAGDVVISSSRAEEVITSAILNVIRDDKINVAMLKGNGAVEKSEFSSLLTKNGFVVSEVNIATDPLEENYDIAILIAPQVDLSEAAIKKIDDFLYNGGDYGKMLVYTADVTQNVLPVTEAYLKEWGVVVGDGVVFETKAERTYQSQPYYPVADYIEKQYSALLVDASVPMIMPLSRPLEVLFSVRDKNYTLPLLMFADTAGVRPSQAAADFAPEQASRWGPMPALVLASKKIKSIDGMDEIHSDILVSSSSEMLDSFSIQNTSLANSEYLVKFFSSAFGKKETVAIVPKSLAGNILTVNTKQKNIIGLVFSIIIPICILAAGIVIFAIRRNQ
jgi:ABC-2 type transport system permease protein